MMDTDQKCEHCGKSTVKTDAEKFASACIRYSLDSGTWIESPNGDTCGAPQYNSRELLESVLSSILTAYEQQCRERWEAEQKKRVLFVGADPNAKMLAQVPWEDYQLASRALEAMEWAEQQGGELSINYDLPEGDKWEYVGSGRRLGLGTTIADAILAHKAAAQRKDGDK